MNLNRYRQARIWWHRIRYSMREIESAHRGTCILCTCGGFAFVTRNDDATSTVTSATCPLWGWLHASRPRIPTARVVQ